MRCLSINSYFAHQSDILITEEAKRFADSSSLSKVNVGALEVRYVHNFFGDFDASVTEQPLRVGLEVRKLLTWSSYTDLPCHTKDVEQLEKFTTDASKKVCDKVNQSAVPRVFWFFRTSEN